MKWKDTEKQHCEKKFVKITKNFNFSSINNNYTDTVEVFEKYMKGSSEETVGSSVIFLRYI